VVLISLLVTVVGMAVACGVIAVVAVVVVHMTSGLELYNGTYPAGVSVSSSSRGVRSLPPPSLCAHYATACKRTTQGKARSVIYVCGLVGDKYK
jgi:hypothetical protein